MDARFLLPHRLREPALLVLILLGGCHLNEPRNPSFDVTRQHAKKALAAMADNPVPLDRPVIVLSGWLDPGVANHAMVQRLRSLATNKQRIVGISFLGADDFDECRRRVLKKLEKKLPAARRDESPQRVDVVAFSMGGLVARHAARPWSEATPWTDKQQTQRLPMARLFTISTPHRGASLARVPTFGRLMQQMTPGSRFITNLNEALDRADYDLIPYVRLGDGIIGSLNAAPPGHGPWWLPTPAFGNAHMAFEDPRVLADIARRLRNEAPFTSQPPMPLPEQFRRP